MGVSFHFQCLSFGTRRLSPMIVRVDGAELPSYRAEQPHPSRSSSFAAKHESGNCPANEPDAKHEDGGNGRRVDTTYVAEEPEDETHGSDQPSNCRLPAAGC